MYGIYRGISLLCTEINMILSRRDHNQTELEVGQMRFKSVETFKYLSRSGTRYNKWGTWRSTKKNKCSKHMLWSAETSLKIQNPIKNNNV